MEKIKYLVSGDCTVCVEFGNEISPEINRRIRAFKIALEKEAVDGVVETIPTYRSLSVVYRPEVIRFGELTKKFDAVLETMDSIQIPPPSVIEIPVLYGGGRKDPYIRGISDLYAGLYRRLPVPGRHEPGDRSAEA